VDDLERVAQEDAEQREMIKRRLFEMKMQERKIKQEETRYNAYLLNAEREAKMEAVIRKKMEFEKMQEQQLIID